jgi:hypothetical protein
MARKKKIPDCLHCAIGNAIAEWAFMATRL